MTPQDFIAKWSKSEVKESAGSQTHFNDLCRLLGLDDPITADPKGEWFTFEKGATKTTGSEGWADVWRKGCFAWEYKGKKKDLDRAFAQLQQYAVALDNPPLLIVSDMDRIRIHTAWTNTVQQVHTITLDDLTDAKVRDRLRDCFLDPEKLKPSKTRQVLTEEAAQRFALIAQRLRGRGHDPEQVAHFVNRLVFCMFAEDVNLLPNKLFEQMIKAARPNPDTFATHAKTLFGAMRSGGLVGFQPVEWFNGGLFDDDTALPLTWEDIDDLTRATALDWSDIDPSILGTLFERGLDPDKRSQLGAHYTDRDKIMMIVRPVIIEPLMAEWAATLAQMTALIDAAPKATKEKLLVGTDLAARTRAFNQSTALRDAFLDRLITFRVLDPACGSGNFLYLSLLALKDIEHRANLDAEALGLQRPLQAVVGPQNVLGIELNPYAAELARVSVWIGEIQWMRRNGFEAAKNPILRKLDTIENRDAVLAPDGTRAAWPKADVVVGNPPFLGTKRMFGSLGVEYAESIRATYPELSPFSDLVCWWFAQAREEIKEGRLGRAGLVATNSIRGGKNRTVLDRIEAEMPIFEAWSDEPWVVDGAAVRVSLVCFGSPGFKRQPVLNGVTVAHIESDLTGTGLNITRAGRLPQNRGTAFVGTVKSGQFDITRDVAERMIRAPQNPNGRPNSDVVLPWRNGMDLVRRSQDKWIIDFGVNMPLQAAQLYEAPFGLVEQAVKPERAKVKRARYREFWWLQAEPCSGMRGAIATLPRYLASPVLTKHRLFVWLGRGIQPDHQLIAIARDDDTTFGILHSRFHELWALRMGTSLEDRPRYTPSTTFETFPFPEGLTPNIPAADYATDPRAQAIAAVAARLNDLRENWLNPPDLVVRVPEVVPGYPDRILPRNDAAAAVLKKRTLTNLYNARPAWLDHAHRALDEAVADAYGWGDDWRAGLLTEDETLARLFHLNQERAAQGR